MRSYLLSATIFGPFCLFLTASVSSAQTPCTASLKSPTWAYTQALIQGNSRFPQMDSVINMHVVAHLAENPRHLIEDLELRDDYKSADEEIKKLGVAMSRLHRAHGVPHRSSADFDPVAEADAVRVPAPRLGGLFWGRLDPAIGILNDLITVITAERSGRPQSPDLTRWVEIKQYRRQGFNIYLQSIYGQELAAAVLSDLQKIGLLMKEFLKSPPVKTISQSYTSRLLKVGFTEFSEAQEVMKELSPLYQKFLENHLIKEHSPRFLKQIFELTR